MAVKGKTKFDIAFDIVNVTILTLLVATYIYVLVFVVSASFSSPNAVYNGTVRLWPVDPTLEAYTRVFNEKMVWIGYRNSFFYMVIGTIVSVTMTVTAAYALSRSDLPGRGIITGLFVFTMFFGGGIIPTYLIVMNLGLLDSLWALILPGAVSMSNVIIARTFFVSGLPRDLLESAQIDGCGNTRFFLSIALPLSKSIIAVLALFYAVGYWSDYFNAMLYIKTRTKYPLQLFLREILISAQQSSAMTEDLVEQAQLMETAEIIKYALIVVASVPMLIIYPFIQKHFVKGVMIGSLKG
ncbi:MAG: carbohydrate ABC transporter permease [Christensenellales bacterium]|jgi:putative aldouronate transport system permease protein